MYTFVMTADELSELVATQRTFFLTGKTEDIQFRKQQLSCLKRTLLKYQNKIQEALAQDLRKSPEEAYTTEFALILREIDFLMRRISWWSKPTIRLPSFEVFPGIGKIYSQPYGCVLIITPWNFPFQIPLIAVASAISAGNCVILKPSHHAQASEQLLTTIIQETFPQEQVAVVTGGNELHHSLMTQKYDFIFYTGGSTAGKKIAEAAARNLTPICLELGGKNPCIVDSTAEIDLAAKRIIWGKLINSGQNCIAPDYVLVQAEKRKELIEKLCFYMEQFYGNNPVTPDSTLASIVNERHFFRLLNLANGNNPANGVVITNNPAGQSYNKEALKIKPILLDSPEREAPVMQDEIFGPILPIIPYNQMEEAMAFIQEKPEPLVLYLFSQDKATQKLVAQRLRYGGGCINDTLLQAITPYLPFGGTGHSGMGKYHGKAGFDTFSHQKSILFRPTKFDIDLRYPPRSDRKSSIIKMLFK